LVAVACPNYLQIQRELKQKGLNLS
jgi:hypothetical protein